MGGAMPLMSRLITASIRSYTLPGVVAVGLFLIFCSQATSLGQAATNTGARERQPLRYRLIVSKPSVCPNESIELELELENASNHRVLIDPRALVHTVSISREGGGVGSTGDFMGKITADQLVALEADRSYRKTISYPLQGKFFLGGLYSIHVTYGQFAKPSPKLPDLYTGTVESNTVLFEIKDCG
jgi:hypothetical protein